MAFTVFVLVVVLAFIATLAYQKYRGNQALTFTHVDITGLSLDEIVAIGSKASRSLSDRLTRRAPAVRRVGSGVEWQVQIHGSVMAFSAKPLPDGDAYRVGGAATRMRIAQTNIGSNRGVWGLSKAMTNGIYRTLGIPQNPSALVRLRKRVLREIAHAGILTQPIPPQYLSPAEPTGTAS
jgi:hypothetical protein